MGKRGVGKFLKKAEVKSKGRSDKAISSSKNSKSRYREAKAYLLGHFEAE